MIARLPLRVKLTAAFAVAMLAILALAGVFVHDQVRANLNEALDEGLGSRADDVAALVAASDARVPPLEGDRLVESEDSFAQVLAPHGEVLASTLPGGDPALSASEASSVAGGELVTGERPIAGIDGEARLLARSADSGDRTLVVAVGATTEDRRETLAGLTSAFALGTPVAALLAALLGYLLAGRALAPVEAMRRRAAEITLERSGERLALPAAEDELRSLARTLNEMLDRIEGSLERERAFVADASHELRTPLAILRGELELATKPGRDPTEMRAALLSAAEEVERLTLLAEDLLVIARSDQGRLPIKRERVEPGELLDRVRRRFAARAERESREISIASPAPAANGAGTLDADALRLEQALGNLVDNALRHGEGEVRLGVAVADDGQDEGVVPEDAIAFTVEDEGPGLPAEFAPRAFERFTRADSGRARGGSGLGLSIVRAIAHAHGGEVSVSGARATISIPRRP